MSVDSKVFVVCGKDKTLDVGEAVMESLKGLSMALLNKEMQKETWHSSVSFCMNNKDWSVTVVANTNNFSSFTFTFKIGEIRTLWFHTDCSCDTDEITKEHTLNFSIGNWGKSEEIMQVVIKALKPFGDVYYDHNDCDDEGYVKV